MNPAPPPREPRRRPGPAPRGGRSPGKFDRADGERRPARPYDGERRPGWGGVARTGAERIKSEGRPLETRASKRAPEPADVWVEEVASPITRREDATARAVAELPGEIASQVRRAVMGSERQRERAVENLAKAQVAYERHRYEESLRLAERTCEVAPDVAGVRELAGLAAYRAQEWNRAKAHLRRVIEISTDPQYLPLIMDCDRAHHRYRAVQATYDELIELSPTADVLTEARIVLAGSLGDQGKYREAVEILSAAGATRRLRNPGFRHLRMWYAMADMLDRAGDTSAARDYFSRVVEAEPDAYDARARLAELGVSTSPRPRAPRTRPASHKKD